MKHFIIKSQKNMEMIKGNEINLFIRTKYMIEKDVPKVTRLHWKTEKENHRVTTSYVYQDQ